MLRAPLPVKRVAQSFWDDDLLFRGGRAAYLRRYARWHLINRLSNRAGPAGAERATMILLSYRRPENMEALARSALRCAFVDKVIVSNNNPAVRIRDWVRARGRRLVLHDEARGGPAGTRFEIAREQEASFFLAIDDDVFLDARQLFALFRSLVRDPAVPHAIWGQTRRGDGPGPSSEQPGETPELRLNNSIGYREGPVDIVNRGYAFTKAHVGEYFRLLAALGVESSWELGAADDLVLSFTGARKPWCHDLGPILDCPTSHKTGVAVCRTVSDFVGYRLELFRKLSLIKPLD